MASQEKVSFIVEKGTVAESETERDKELSGEVICREEVVEEGTVAVENETEREKELSGEVTCGEEVVKKKGRWKTGYNLFMQMNSRTLTELGNQELGNQDRVLGANAKLIGSAWRKIPQDTRKDWNKLAQKEREDVDCGILDTINECKKCSKMFSRRSDMMYHQRRCGRVKCKECFKEFTDEIQLNVHSRIHGELFKCSTCSKCFSTQQGLKRHEVSHSTYRGFCCEICKVEFSLKTNLRRHMKNKH